MAGIERLADFLRTPEALAAMARSVGDRCRRDDQARLSAGAVWMAGLLFKPLVNLASPVADGAADLEAARATAEVAVVAQGGDGDAHEFGDFDHGEELV